MNTASRCAALVGAGRLERLFRAVHQCRAQRDRADRAVPGRRQPAGRHRLRPHPAGARHRPAARAISITPISPGGSPNRKGATTSPRCPTGRRVPHMFIVVFLIMLPIYLKTHDALLAWRVGAGVVPRHRRDRAARRLCRADRAQIHAARGDARHPRRHFDRLYLDAPGLSRLGGPVAVSAVAGDRPGQLDGRRAAALRPARRPCRGGGRHRTRLARPARPPRQC